MARRPAVGTRLLNFIKIPVGDIEQKNVRNDLFSLVQVGLGWTVVKAVTIGSSYLIYSCKTADILVITRSLRSETRLLEAASDLSSHLLLLFVFPRLYSDGDA